MTQDIHRRARNARREIDSPWTLRALRLTFVVVFTAAAAAGQDQVPRFQTTVDVTSLLEVTVVDSTGQPITGLGRGDFNVKIDGNERRVLSAEWVPVVENARARGDDVSVPEGYSSNENMGGGRLIVIAIDQISIRFGGSTAMMKTLEGFIDKLLPSDRLAVVGFGPGGTPLTFLGDLNRAKQIVSRMTGNKQPGAPTTYNVGLGESLSIGRGELGMLDGAIARECANMAPRTYQYSVCSTGVKDDAGQIAREALEQANNSINGMVDLFTALRSIDAPKTVLMISEGFVVDDTQTFASELGLMAAAARANLYVLHLNETAFDSNSGRRPPSAIEDRRIGVVGLEALANAAGGYMFTINGAGTPVFDRLQAELSGYYQVGIQPDPRDRDGKPHPIRIDVPWNGAVVRSRRQLMNSAPPPVDRRNPQAAVAAGLSSPLPMSTLPLRVATFALQGADPGKVQLLIHADVGNDFSTARRVSIGYTILDQNGHEVEAQRLDSRLSPVMNGVPSALQYVSSASLAPGDYTLKLAAADGERIGNVEHRFHAKLAESGAVKLSELMTGGPTAVREFLSPTIGYTVSFGSVHGYLEAYGNQAEAVTVKYEIAASAAAPPLIAADVPGRLFGDDRMIFTLVMPVQQLPPGRYVLRALVSLAARPLKTLTRPFEIAARPPIAVSVDGASSAADADAAVFLPVDEQAFVRPFQRDEALKPEVVKLFFDRLAPAAQAAFDAGVKALTAGDYRKAEASFKSGVGPDFDSTSLLVYLGAVYAANNDDRQAVGAWQTALFGAGDIPEVYAWLTQGQLRRHSLPDAQEVLEEAHEKWPSDARFTGPLAAVYATFGRGREAALLLEQYLDKNRDDVEAASVGVEWLYQIHAAGHVAHNAAEDLALARAWAARYGNGPRQALVKQWLDVLEREPR
jgi:VWFA-related protein